jgi:lipopolysaccharide transport system ATP-binding protein
MARLLLEATGLSKRFCRYPKFAFRYATADLWRELRGKSPGNGLRAGEFWALRDVDLRLEAGEVLGVIGHNGAGKSTLINLAAGLMLPTRGRIELHTNRVALMDNNGGLNMVETGRENIAAQLALHGCPGRRIHDEMEAVIEFAELGEFIDASVGTYSLGMRLRLTFSIYTRLKPDLFIVDEALSGGDLRFRQKFQKYLREYIDEGGSILLCSHDLFMIQLLCRQCVLLDKGQVCRIGDTEEVVTEYQQMMDMEARAKQEAPQEVATEAPIEALQVPIEARTEPLGDIATIEGIRISAPDGGEIVPGGPVEIEIACHSPEPVAQVIWGLEIGRGDLFPMASFGAGAGTQKYPLKSGHNTLRCRIDRFPFLPGRYEVRASVVDQETGALLASKGYENVAATLEVKGRPSLEINGAVFRNSFVYIPAEWD